MAKAAKSERGARVVDRATLAQVPTPERTRTWITFGHEEVIATVTEQLEAAGFAIESSQFCLTRGGDARMFATLDLSEQLTDGVSLTIGVQNSFDKCVALGFMAGSRVNPCKNLAFRSDLMVAQKHTRFGADRFLEDIQQAVRSLDSFKKEESARIDTLRQKALSDETAESIMLRAFETDIVSGWFLPGVIREWREPSVPIFAERTAWSLYNAFLTVLGPRFTSDPARYAKTTIKLGALIDSLQRRRRGAR